MATHGEKLDSTFKMKGNQSASSVQKEADVGSREASTSKDDLSTCAVTATKKLEGATGMSDAEHLELSFVPGKTMSLSTVVGKEKYMKACVPTPASFKAKKCGGHEDADPSNYKRPPLSKPVDSRVDDVAAIISSPTTGLAIFKKNKHGASGAAEKGSASPSLAGATRLPSLSLVSHIEEVPSLKKQGTSSPNPTANSHGSDNMTSGSAAKILNPNPKTSEGSAGATTRPQKLFPVATNNGENSTEPSSGIGGSHHISQDKRAINKSFNKNDQGKVNGVEHDSTSRLVSKQTVITSVNLKVEGTEKSHEVAGGKHPAMSGIKVEDSDKAADVADRLATTLAKDVANVKVERAESSHEMDADGDSIKKVATAENGSKKKKQKEGHPVVAIKKSKRKIEDQELNKRGISVSSVNSSQDEVAGSFLARHVEPAEHIAFGSLTKNPLLEGLNKKLMKEEVLPTGQINSTTKEMSFLESMSEEERRTRNRHIPDVKGFRRLHRHEIKRDIKAVKNHDLLPWMAALNQHDGGDEAAELAADMAAAAEGMHGGDDAASIATSMDVEEEASMMSGAAVAEAAVASAENSSHAGPFVPPTHYDIANRHKHANGYKSDEEEDEDDDDGDATKKIKIRYPNQVESIVAFDPPRDDVILQGRAAYTQRKKQRMAYWEQHPHEMDLSLQKFESTVRKTRWEWRNAELERERVEEIGATLRHHLLQQARTLREESIITAQQAALYQRQCVLEAELMASRTRSRGGNSHSMRDVLSVLRSRGEKIVTFPSATEYLAVDAILPESNLKGKATLPMPGDPVATVYGKGTVKEITDAFISKPNDTQNASRRILIVTPQKVVVQLAFGVAYVSFGDISPLTTGKRESCLNNSNLVSRWKGLLQMAEKCEFADVEKEMSHVASKEGYEEPPNDAAPFNIDLLSAIEEAEEKAKAAEERVPCEKSHASNAGLSSDAVGSSETNLREQESRRGRAIPFQGGLLPMGGGGRAGVLAKCELNPVQAELDRVTHDCGRRVLGRPDNPAVPEDIKKWESDRHQLYILKAKALRLRNRLLQQKRARVTNERAYATADERSERVSLILDEMKSDLTSLKTRLADELMALGIDQDRARQILADHLAEQESWADDHPSYQPSQRGPNRKLQEQSNSFHGSDIGASVRSTRRKAQEAMRGHNDDANSMVDGQDLDSISMASASRRAKRARLEDGISDFVEKPKNKRHNRRQ
jgi:hypothetical protein